MKITRGNWKLESISGTWYIMITNTKYNEERAVSSRGVPSVEALQAMSDLEFDRAARGVFLGWNMAREKRARLPFRRIAAAVFLFGAAVVIWAGMLLWD